MISTVDEWSPLKKIVVGSATDANWPVNDPVFSKESEKTTWTETPVPCGPVPQRIINEANEDLDILATTLMSFRCGSCPSRSTQFSNTRWHVQLLPA